MTAYTKTIFICAILGVILLSGCVDLPGGHQPEEKRIYHIDTGQSLILNSSEVVAINFDVAKQNLSLLGYVFINGSNGYIQYVATMDVTTNRTYGEPSKITINILSYPDRSYIYGAYHSTIEIITEKQVGEKEQYLLDRMKEVAGVCNLTVNWSQVKWSIIYSD